MLRDCNCVANRFSHNNKYEINHKTQCCDVVNGRSAANNWQILLLVALLIKPTTSLTKRVFISFRNSYKLCVMSIIFNLNLVWTKIYILRVSFLVLHIC